MDASELPVVAVDPGREKCGVAVVAPGGRVLFRQVVSRQALVPLVERLGQEYRPRALVLGSGTESQAVARALGGLAWVAATGGVQMVDERGSSQAGRQRYWKEHPPRGLWRLVPTALRLPPEPWDDLAAVVLAERFLAILGSEGLVGGVRRPPQKP